MQRAYYFGNRLLVELDIVLAETMPLKEAHDIGESLQFAIERLDIVERAFGAFRLCGPVLKCVRHEALMYVFVCDRLAGWLGAVHLDYEWLHKSDYEHRIKE